MNAKTNMQRTLPSSWYQSGHVFGLEREHIFFKEWICVGREEELTAAGDHLVLGVMGESIILLRKPNDDLRAFYNVCRHRGAQLCVNTEPGKELGKVAGKGLGKDPENGAAKTLLGDGISKKYIVCPYHSWTYDLDGQLQSAPHIPADREFDSSDIWKIICENYNECYHCGPVHPELCRIVPMFRKNGGTDLPWDDGIPHKPGAYNHLPVMALPTGA